MQQRSPRRRLFNEYARQLQRRYPSMRDEVQARLQRVNAVWEQLQRAVCPAPAGARDEAAMIKGECGRLQVGEGPGYGYGVYRGSLPTRMYHI